MVDFTAVDSIPEDSLGYDRVSVGHFRVAGLGRGGYLPLVILPQPKLHRILAINSEVELGKNIFVGAEYAGSTLEQNRFSSDPRSRLNGGALKLNTRMLPTQVSVGAFALGKLGFSAAHRRVDGTFRSTDRFNEVEFDRKWNAASINTVAEEINEVSTMYSPLSALSAAVEYGTLKREGESESRRLGSEIAFADSNKPYVRYKREFISSTKLLNDMSSSWIRERGDGTYDLGVVIPEVRVERESKQSRLSNRDSLFGESYSFLETAAKVTARQTGAVSASAEFQVRSADSALGGIAMPAFNSFTQLYGVQVTSWKSVSTSLQLNLRRVEFDPKFQRRGNQNTEVVLVRSQTRMTPLDRSIETDLFYEFSNQRSARMERIFVRVQKGTGTYRYKGDVNGNGQPDDNEFEQTRFDGDYVAVYVPGETLVPVLDVKASLRLRLTPSRLIRFPATAMEKLLTLFSSETYARVDEKSTEEDEKQIYLLNFSRFQNSRTTITGATVFTQDVYYNESSPEFSLRLRYGERRGMTQLISASERTLQQERSLRIRSQLVREIGNTTDIGMRTDRSVASTASPRDRNLEIISLQSNFSYRPEREWEIEFQLGLSNTRDTFAERNVVSNINEQAIRIGYGFAGTGQVRAEVRREDVVLQGNSYPTGVMPYEFTAGKSLGKSFFWQLSTDYRITSFIQLTINYFGRSESGRAVVHTATAEARAFF
ncbi:MAG: hypothetical protein HY966_04300 [Ignavibacteriales bacterium]|nr:hypothetical protein [Ignavibacteriales bacterium]